MYNNQTKYNVTLKNSYSYLIEFQNKTNICGVDFIGK